MMPNRSIFADSVFCPAKVPGPCRRCRVGSAITIRLSWPCLCRGLSWTDYIRYSSNMTLLVALSMGLYVRWLHSDDITILLIAFLALFVFFTAVMLVYYFSLNTVGYSLMRLWIGCLEGVVGFTGLPLYEDGTERAMATAMNITFVLSVILRLTSTLLEHIFYQRPVSFSTSLPTYLSDRSDSHRAIDRFKIADPMDCLEVVGFACSTLVIGRDFVSATLLSVGLLITVCSVRLKSCSVALIQLPFMLIHTMYIFYPRLLGVSLNTCAYSNFIVRVAADGIASLYFCGLTPLQRWHRILISRRFVIRLLIIAIIALEVAFITVHLLYISTHKEWYIVVPIFTALSVVWFCYHIIFVVILWLFVSRLAECVNTFKQDDCDSVGNIPTDLRRIMSSRGLRYFGLVARSVVLVTALTTILVGVVAWETKVALGVALWMIVLPVELALTSLMGSLGSELGGTAMGYALITPTIAAVSNHGKSSLESVATLLSPGVVDDVTSRSMRLLHIVQHFFTYHLIDQFGCDYSSSGQSLEGLETKLRLLFQRVTADGPRYDTYIIYYNGPVHSDGDWALTDGERLRLDTLLTLWRAADPGSTSRLILIVDADNAYHWLDGIRKVKDICVALQTWRYVNLLPLNQRRVATSFDVELGRSNLNSKTSEPSFEVGSFTEDWVDYNINNERRTDWRSSARCVRALYSVSRPWTDFTFRRLTTTELSRYWDSNFPRMTRILVRGATGGGVLSGTGTGCVCSECLVRCIRRKRMAWLQPIECDTGHGFKLVRSLVN